MPEQRVRAYGVLETADRGGRLQAEELFRLGYTILESGLTESAIEELRSKLFTVYDTQAAEFGGDLGRLNDADVARCLLAYDEAFFKLATVDSLLSFCTDVFGPSFTLLQQNGLINRPSREHYQLNWHRDLPYQHWVSSKPIALAALFCLDEFSEVTGGTHGLPGSHLKEDFPSDEFVVRHERVMAAPAGSFIVMDAMMFHRAGRNTSDRDRCGVNHLIGLPFLSQQIDIPRMLDGAHAGDEALAGYLGYRWGPAASVDAWRAARLRANGRAQH